MSAKPFVSVICPTYNRRRFLPYLCHIFNYQEWPANRMELIILDDSPESNQDIIDKHNKNKNIRYIHHPEKLKLGKKRNMLNSLVKGEYIVCMDDDDYYPPDRVKTAIGFMQGRKAIICGSSEMYIYFTQLDKTYVFNKIAEKHATNGTFAYHKSFLKDHKYDDEAEKAEEKVFLKDYSAPLIQLPPLSSIVCIAHTNNTFDKNNIRQNLKPTAMKLKNFCKDKILLNFYRELAKEHATPEDQIVVKPPNPGVPQVFLPNGQQLPVEVGSNGIPMVYLPNGQKVPISEIEEMNKRIQLQYQEQLQSELQHQMNALPDDLKNLINSKPLP
jgi:glycosyltransferase involved in cell wall biosynthesis